MTTIVSIFTIIAALSTVIYTIITVRTLKEIRKQRETTYMPNVILGDSGFTMCINESLDFETISFEDVKTKEKSKECYLNIYNIGLASATDLSFKFEFNDQSLAKIATDSIPKLHIEILSNGFISIDYKNLQTAHNLYGQKYFSKDFLLPVNIDNSSLRLNLPSYVIYVIYFLVYKIDDNYDILKNLPDFKLLIEFIDINDKKFVKSYNLNLNIFPMTKTDVIFEILKK
jgi:hypothetical protein